MKLNENNRIEIQEEPKFSFDSLHLIGEKVLIAMQKVSANSYKARINIGSKWLELNDLVFKLDLQELSDTIQMISANKKIVYISANSNTLVEVNLSTLKTAKAKKENESDKIIAFDLTPNRDLIYVEFGKRIRVFMSTNLDDDLSKANFVECSLSGSFENIQSLLVFKFSFAFSYLKFRFFNNSFYSCYLFILEI